MLRLNRLQEFGLASGLRAANFALAAGKNRDDGLWNGRRYFLDDWVDGVSLSETPCDKERPKDLALSIRVLWDLSRVVSQLHRLGVAHRDISPEHVLIKPDCSVSLIDFGLARARALTRRRALVCM
jgi:serine/threonine protein kinase